jgi:DNA-binding XRE family transcriptional regulator
MLGNQLKEYRKKKGYTQKEAADELGVVRQTISKWEHETVGVVLSASINLITKGAAKAIVGVMFLVVSG